MAEKPHIPRAPHPAAIGRLDLSAPPPPAEETMSPTSVRAPRIAEDDRITAIEQAIIPMQTAIGALQMRLDTHRATIDASIAEVKRHLTHQDTIALERDGTVNEIYRIVKDSNERERKRLRQSVSDAKSEAELENLQAGTQDKKASAEIKREELGLGWWTKTRRIVATIAAIVALIVTLAGLATSSQLHHPLPESK